MPYQIQLLEGQTVLDETADRDSWLEQCAFDIASDSWRLGDLDPSGVTMFNRIQAGRLLEEVGALKPHAVTTEQKALLVRLEEMLVRCRDSDSLLVMFRGGGVIMPQAI